MIEEKTNKERQHTQKQPDGKSAIETSVNQRKEEMFSTAKDNLGWKYVKDNKGDIKVSGNEIKEGWKEHFKSRSVKIIDTR